MVEAIARDQKRVFPVCMKLEGEYGINGTYLGVPVVLGRAGIERVLELKLNEEESELLRISDNHVREVMRVFDNMRG
jgi:malate dehydrogenase